MITKRSLSNGFASLPPVGAKGSLNEGNFFGPLANHIGRLATSESDADPKKNKMQRDARGCSDSFAHPLDVFFEEYNLSGSDFASSAVVSSGLVGKVSFWSLEGGRTGKISVCEGRAGSCHRLRTRRDGGSVTVDCPHRWERPAPGQRLERWWMEGYRLVRRGLSSTGTGTGTPRSDESSPSAQDSNRSDGK